MYIYIVFIIAFLLRLPSLNQSLWLDEATTAQTIRHFSYPDLITRFAPTDFHPPFYYLFMKLWTSVFGYSEIALRMPSIIFSLITGWFVYLIGKKIINSKSGIWGAAFFLFNPLIVYYSQEARMYSMATCFLTISVYLFIQITLRYTSGILIIKLKAERYYLFFMNLFIALSLFTFYGSVFLIAAMYFSVFILRFMDSRFRGNDEKKRSYQLFFLILPGSVFALLILSPLLYTQYMHSKEMLNLVPNWSLVLGKANIKNLLLIPLKFSIGRIQFEPKYIYYITSGIWTLFVFSHIVKGGFKNKIIGFLFAVPLVLGFIFSFFTPLLQYFRFLYLIPLYSLLLMQGLSSNGKRILYLTVFVLLSLVYLVTPQFHRENWKQLAESVKSGSDIYMVYTSSDPLQYYFDQNKNSSRIHDLRELDHQIKQSSIVVIPYTADIHGIEYQKKLTDQKYKKIFTKIERELSAEVWEKKRE